MVLALDLVQPVAERLEEVVIGGDDRAVQVELDHRLGLADGGDLALEIGVLQLGGGDIRGELDDLERLAVEVEDRVVGGLDPDFLAALADALVLRGLELAVVEVAPELLVFRAVPVGRLDKHAVVLALDLVQAVAEDFRKLSLAVMTVPSRLNSMTAWALLIGGDLALEVGVLQLRLR